MLWSSHSPASSWHSLRDEDQRITKWLVFVQCFSLVFWPSASSDNLHLFSSLYVLSVALEPNYPPRTHRSYHQARSRFIAHHAHYTRLQNSQHTCRRIERGVDEALANSPFICRQVQIHVTFGFQRYPLDGYFGNHVSYLLYWSQVDITMLDKSHSQMGVCYLWTVKNSAL